MKTEQITKKNESIAEVVTTVEVNFDELVEKRNAIQEQLDTFDAKNLEYRQPMVDQMAEVEAEIAKYKDVGFEEKTLKVEVAEQIM